MARHVFIQYTDTPTSLTLYSAQAVRGFTQLGFPVTLFSRPELESLPLQPDSVVVGGKGTVQAALALRGYAPPQHLTLPEELWPYAGRECWRTTPDDLRAAGDFPVFVKPYIREKVFAGQVLQKVEDLEGLMVPRPGFPPVTADFDILAQRPVTFLSEWKSYVVRGQTVGISHQKGDSLLFPDPQVIRDVLAAYRNAPAGHGADYGVLDNGKTVLVEINDGYALGQGGLHAATYAELLLARWDELTAQGVSSQEN